jgi:hypothetical protein
VHERFNHGLNCKGFIYTCKAFKAPQFELTGIGIFSTP